MFQENKWLVVIRKLGSLFFLTSHLHQWPIAFVNRCWVIWQFLKVWSLVCWSVPSQKAQLQWCNLAKNLWATPWNATSFSFSPWDRILSCSGRIWSGASKLPSLWISETFWNYSLSNIFLDVYLSLLIYWHITIIHIWCYAGDLSETRQAINQDDARRLRRALREAPRVPCDNHTIAGANTIKDLFSLPFGFNPRGVSGKTLGFPEPLG